MTKQAKMPITLFHWNILVLPTGEELFVGLHERPATVPPFLPPDADNALPFTLRNSSPIRQFDTLTGVGFTDSGRRYVVIGEPSDPTGMIRFSVEQMMANSNIRWKFDFAG